MIQQPGNTGRAQLSSPPRRSQGHLLSWVCGQLFSWLAVAGFWGLWWHPPHLHVLLSSSQLAQTRCQSPRAPNFKCNAHMFFMAPHMIHLLLFGESKLPGQALSQVGSIIPQSMILWGRSKFAFTAISSPSLQKLTWNSLVSVHYS